MIDLIRSEIVKIRTVRSTVVMIAIVVVLGLVPSALVTALVKTSNFEAMEPFELASLMLIGVQFSSTLLAVIAALVITGEHRFGTIRTTFLAEPRRWRVFVAKFVTVVGLATVVAAVMVTVSVTVSTLILKARGVHVVLGDDPVPRLLYGMVLYSVVYAVLALGLGTLLRNSAAAIVLVIVVPWIVENIVAGILSAVDRGSWGKWLPFAAGQRIFADDRGRSVLGDRLSPWAGYGYCWVWALALCALGAWLLQRRDA